MYKIPAIYCSICTFISFIKDNKTSGHASFKYINFCLYKAIHKLSPVCFRNYFIPNSSVHRIGTCRSTRGDLFLSVKRTNLYGFQTVQYTLPLFIRVAGSISLFRSKLKAHYIDSDVLSVSLSSSTLEPSFPWGTSGFLFFFFYINNVFSLVSLFLWGGALSRLVYLLRELLLNQSILYTIM